MKLDIDNNILNIKLNPLESIFSFRRSLQLPINHITGVSTTKPPQNWGQIRAPGTRIPFLIKAGTYLGSQSKEFWYTTIGKPYLIIELEEWDYDRVVITKGDNERWAELIDQARKNIKSL